MTPLETIGFMFPLVMGAYAWAVWAYELFFDR